MEKVKIKNDFTIQLPEGLKKLVSKGDEFIVTITGDSIKLQRINKPDICDLASSVDDKEMPSLEEISGIVHKIRELSETQGSN